MRNHALDRRSIPILVLAVIITITLFISGCSAEALVTQIDQIALTDSDSAETKPGYANRLLVQGTDGNIYTMEPSGRNRLALTRDGGSSRQYLQPTWSMTGDSIAWTSIETVGASTRSALITSRADGSVRSELTVPFPPFYIYWSPQDERLAYLSNWTQATQPSMALRVVDLVIGSDGDISAEATTVAEGAPFYFSWAPDGKNMVTHIGNERVEMQSIDGEQTSLFASSGTFPTPHWSHEGDLLFYAISDDNGVQELIISDTQGTWLDTITDFDDRITFTISQDSNSLAYVITGASVGTAALGPLYVINLETKSTRELSSKPVFAFFWSPDSSKLAYMVPETVDGAIRFRWYVWDGSQVTAYQAFLPSRTFLQSYLAFFDQYAQSTTIWAPDSSAFTYAGSDENGRFGIWVQQLGADAKPQLVSRGVMSTWSPR